MHLTDDLIVTQALATMLVVLERLPEHLRPTDKLNAVKQLLARREPVLVASYIARAQIWVDPDLDPLKVFGNYGFNPQGC